MGNISEMELQNLRHLIGANENTHCKMSSYAENAKDSNIKQYFQKSAQSAEQTKEQLMQFLQ